MHKRLVMLSVAALGLTAASQGALAQAMLPVPKPTFGVLAGLNVAKLSGNDASNVSSHSGFAGGVFLTLHLTNSFGIEPEALFSQQGAKDDEGGGVATVKLNYIQIPVLLRYDIPSSSAPIHPFIVLGPSASIQVGCNVSGTSGETTVNESCDALNDQTDGSFKKKSFDYAAVGGAGIAFNLGATAVSVSARYNYGFNDTFESADLKNRHFSILAGFSF